MRFGMFIATEELARYVNSSEHKIYWNIMLTKATHKTQALIENVGLGPTDLLVCELSTYSYIFLIIPLADGQILTYKNTMGINGIGPSFEFTTYPINTFLNLNVIKVSWNSVY